MQSSNPPKSMLHDHAVQYWIGQIIFWFGLSVVPFLGIVFWYNTTKWVYIEHMFLQALLGLLLSVPLGWLYSLIWKMHPVLRMVFVLTLAGGFAATWTSVRIITYIWLTDEVNTWNDFGGWYFGAFYIFLCWAALYHGMKYYRLLEVEHVERLKEIDHTKEEQIKRLKAESIAREAQLKMLRYQINPHFLFNTLHAIYALIKLKDANKAMGMIAKLGEFLRYSLEYNPEIQVSLEDEANTSMLYLNIEKVRFSDRLNIEFNLTEEAKIAKVPSLLLQPLIENSIKYAVASSETGGIIKINARVENGYLLLDVIDNGPGLGGAKQEPGKNTGVGLRNTCERLETLYGTNHTLTLSPATPRGLHIFIAFPYEPVDSNINRYSTAILETNSESNSELKASRQCP